MAAMYSHLDTLKWLREHDCPWDEDATSGAALHGQLDTLKWMFGQGCPWDERTCGNAAQNGHLVGRYRLNNA